MESLKGMFRQIQ